MSQPVLPTGLEETAIAEVWREPKETERARLLVEKCLRNSSGNLTARVMIGLTHLARPENTVDAAQHPRMAKAIELLRQPGNSAMDLLAKVLVGAARGKTAPGEARVAMEAELRTIEDLIEAAVADIRRRVADAGGALDAADHTDLDELVAAANRALAAGHTRPADSAPAPVDDDDMPPDGTPLPAAEIGPEAGADAREELGEEDMDIDRAFDQLLRLIRETHFWTEETIRTAVEDYRRLERAVRTDARFKRAFIPESENADDRERAARWLHDLLSISGSFRVVPHPALLIYSARNCCVQRNDSHSALGSYVAAANALENSGETPEEQGRLLRVIANDFNNPAFLGKVPRGDLAELIRYILTHKGGLPLSRQARQLLTAKLKEMEPPRWQRLLDRARGLGRGALTPATAASAPAAPGPERDPGAATTSRMPTAIDDKLKARVAELRDSNLVHLLFSPISLAYEPVAAAEDRANAIRYYRDVETTVRTADRFRNAFSPNSKRKARETAAAFLNDLLDAAHALKIRPHPAVFIYEARHECLKNDGEGGVSAYALAADTMGELEPQERDRLLGIIASDLRRPEYLGAIDPREVARWIRTCLERRHDLSETSRTFLEAQAAALEHLEPSTRREPARTTEAPGWRKALDAMVDAGKGILQGHLGPEIDPALYGRAKRIARANPSLQQRQVVFTTRLARELDIDRGLARRIYKRLKREGLLGGTPAAEPAPEPAGGAEAADSEPAPPPRERTAAEAAEIVEQLQTIAPGAMIVGKDGKAQLVVEAAGMVIRTFGWTEDGQAMPGSYRKLLFAQAGDIQWIQAVLPPKYPIGAEVWIERSDGHRHQAKVEQYTDSGLVRMIWDQGGALEGRKDFTIDELDYIQRTQEQPAYRRHSAGAGEWGNVPRAKEAMVVGDLHGEWAAFEGNLKSLGVIGDDGHWNAGDAKLVFQGDILADRGTDSLRILEAIAMLKREASAAGGKVTVLAGNHEDFAIAYLMDRKILDTADVLGICMRYGQGKGLLEFKRFGSRNLRSKPLDDDISTWSQLEQERPQILEAMRNDRTGKALLEEIGSLQLAEIVDDSLIVHTNPNPMMMEALLQHGVDGVNRIFQAGLKAALLEGRKPSPEWLDLEKTFLHTDNRTNFSNEVLARRLREELGVNQIFYGHTDVTHGGKSVRSEVGDLLLVSVDRSAFKQGQDNGERSVATVKRDGHILSGMHAADLRAAA